MTKRQTIQKYFNQRQALSVTDRTYRAFLKDITDTLIKADLDKYGDLTTNTLITPSKRVKARIVSREAGIVAGFEEVKWLLSVISPLEGGREDGGRTVDKRISIKIITHVNDGDRVKPRDTIITLEGRARDILTYERIILNILQRMSGIATATSELVARVGRQCLICPTRKTPLGLLDKKAVSIGGGGTHRLGLHDFILIKENHLALLDRPLSTFKLKGFWEIEVENERQALEYEKLKPSAMMFDNMTPELIQRIIRKLPRNIIFEASGGITGSSIDAYSKTGVAVISLGALTHSARALDIGLDITLKNI